MSGRPGTSSSSNGIPLPNAARVAYSRYDPNAVRNKRLSQLSHGSSDGIPMASTSTSAAPPARVLGSPARILHASSPTSSASSKGSDQGATEGLPMSGQDYFGVKHNDSTTQSMSLRALERGAGPSLSGASSTSASTVHTPSSLGGAVTYNTSGVPSLVTHRSNSSIDSYNSGSIQSDQDYPTSSAASTLHATSTSNISNGIPLPRSRSAMAAFPQANLASPPSTQYRPFIPPSTYARTSSSSSASSPGPSGAAPAPSPGQLGANVANHISLAFARGLNGVNGVVNGSTPVRLPQSASNVANAVWNRLPAGMQQLRNDLAWEHWENNPSGQAYERDESAIPGMHGFGNSTRAAAAARDGNPASANEALAAPPANARSSSLGSVVLGTERLREERPGSSNGAIAASPPSSGRAAAAPR